MRNTGKRYPEDFKKMIVDLYNTGKPRKEICAEYGVTEASVTNWANKVNPGREIFRKPIVSISKDPAIQAKTDSKEILRLKKQNEQFAMENEILKKAIAIFTRENNL